VREVQHTLIVKLESCDGGLQSLLRYCTVVVMNFNCHPSTDASGAYRSIIATVFMHEGTSWGWLAQSAVIGRKCEAVEVK
jgi:hypothetical protein